MKAAVLIFARMDSTRLPNKALLDVGGRPLIRRVIERVRLSKRVSRVLVCTSDREIDDPLVRAAGKFKATIFRGATNDVLRRAVDCTELHQLETVVRISGDSPFIDPALIDHAFDMHLDTRPNATTNVFPRTFPPGASVEVLSRDTLQKLNQVARNREDREHVTRYLYANPGEFRILNMAAEKPYHGVDLAVDTQSDLDQARWIAERLPESHSLDDAVSLARQYRKMHPLEEEERGS